MVGAHSARQCSMHADSYQSRNASISGVSRLAAGACSRIVSFCYAQAETDGRICDDTTVNILICVATEFERSLLHDRARAAGRSSHRNWRRAGERRPCRDRGDLAEGRTPLWCAASAARIPSSGLQVGDVASASHGNLRRSRCAKPVGLSRHEGPRISRRIDADLALQRPADAGSSDEPIRSIRDRLDVHRHQSTAREIEARTGARSRTWKAPRSLTSRTFTACRLAKCAASATSSRTATPRPGVFTTRQLPHRRPC